MVYFIENKEHELPYETKLKVVSKIKTYEDYDYDKAWLTFDTVVEDDSMTAEYQREADFIGSQFTPSQKIKFEKMYVNSHYIDPDDGDSGEVEVFLTLKSESKPTNDDLNYIAELIQINLDEYISVEVKGTVVVTVEEYSLSAYSPIEKEQEVEIDEKASISTVGFEPTWEIV